ncbi:hypothetical protein [Hafnia alvei]|uniref:hypothetical protein n=1 Tax=Hafnia alvei TaxID=569 RepID=UPI001E2A0E34|nr:hypothetical protein [Hafnia alvei]
MNVETLGQNTRQCFPLIQGYHQRHETAKSAALPVLQGFGQHDVRVSLEDSSLNKKMSFTDIIC